MARTLADAGFEVRGMGEVGAKNLRYILARSFEMEDQGIIDRGGLAAAS